MKKERKKKQKIWKLFLRVLLEGRQNLATSEERVREGRTMCLHILLYVQKFHILVKGMWNFKCTFEPNSMPRDNMSKVPDMDFLPLWGKGNWTNPFNFVHEEVGNFLMGSLAQCLAWGKWCVLAGWMTEDITYTNTPCAPMQLHAISRTRAIPFYLQALSFHFPCQTSSPSQTSFSFSSSLNQCCPLLGCTGPLYFTYNTALNMLCLLS